MQYDEESGLHYNYHRTYDPSMGRYTQSDPIGLMGGMNTFAYVGSSPALLSDPFGLAVYLTYHEVAHSGHHHMALLIIPDDQIWAASEAKKKQ